MKRIFKAQSIIERDALLARLQIAGIEGTSPPRDMSRKVTNATIDLSLDGYSVLFDGFDVLVPDQDADRAATVLIQFLTDAHASVPAPVDRSDWDRFYSASIFSPLLPLVLSAIATFYLGRALIRRQPWPRGPLALIPAIVCFIAGWSLPLMIAASLLK